MAPLGNPRYAEYAGPEVLPIGEVVVPADLGTRWGFEHTYRAAPVTPTVGADFQPQPGELQLRHIMFELWAPGQAEEIDQVRRLVLPVRDLTDGAGVSFVKWLGESDLHAISTRGNGSYALFNTLSTGTNWLKLWFGMGDLNATDRIVRMGIRYAGFQIDAAVDSPTQGWDVVWVDTSTDAYIGEEQLLGSWVERNPSIDTAVSTLRWCGESNLIPRGPATVTSPWQSTPWTVEDISHMANGDESAYIEMWGMPPLDGDGGELLGLDFVELVVDVVRERRVGVSGRTITGTSTIVAYSELEPAVEPYLWTDPFDSTGGVTLATVGPWKATVREAPPADASDRAPGNPSYGLCGLNVCPSGGFGPAVLLRGVQTQRPTLLPEVVVDRAVVVDGVTAEPPQDYPDAQFAMVVYDPADMATDGPIFRPYRLLRPYTDGLVYSGHPVNQEFTATGSQAYRRIRAVVMPPVTADTALTLQITGVIAANVTGDQVRALPDVGGGWRVFEVDFGANYTPAIGARIIAGVSSVAADDPWRISGAIQRNDSIGYSDMSDFALTAIEAPYVPAAPSVTPGSTAVTNSACGASEIDYADVSWVTNADADLYGIERSINGGPWVTIGHDTASPYRDWNVPWDIPVDYRVTSYREGDLATGTSPSGTPALTFASSAALVGLTDGTTAVVYAPSGTGTEYLTWESLNPTDLVLRHGQDYQVPQRPYEDFGWACTFTAVVKHLGACPNETGLTLAQRTMTPDAYETLRALARKPALSVRFAGGMVRTMTVASITPTVHTPMGVHMVSIRLVDTQPVFDPPPLEGGYVIPVFPP